MNRLMDTIKKRLGKVRGQAVFLAVVCVLCVILAMLPTGIPLAVPENGSREKARVESVDNSMLAPLGIVYSGTQTAQVTLLTGPYKGQTVMAVNALNSALDKDKLFESGDTALVLVQSKDGQPFSATLIDHYRVDTQLLLLLLFAVLIILIGGISGCGALISLTASVLLIWKVLIPMLLKGIAPIPAALLTVALLTSVTMFLVGGFTRRALTAFLGSILGTALTCVLTIVFGDLLRMDGGDIPYATALLAQSSLQIDLRQLYFAMVFLGNSGALMDLAMDIASACDEVSINQPAITRGELIRSGFSVSRSVIGTQTTTLMLAYSGNFLSMLMYFMAQGTPVIDILNYKFVVSEILLTLVGSFGLVTVAPFTALVSGWVCLRRKNGEAQA